MKSVMLPEGKGNTCRLYNGIEIPADWPPSSLRVSDEVPFPDLGTAYAVDDPRELTARRPPPAVPTWSIAQRSFSSMSGGSCSSTIF